MENTSDITVILICHREGPLVVPALASMHDMVDVARDNGLTVEARVVLDHPDELTRNTVNMCGGWLDAAQEVSFGDLGLARNAGTASATGDFLAFLDGDDLWGADWLRLAHAAATRSAARKETIWHPSSVYYFVEGDFDRHSQNTTPHQNTQSFHLIHNDSESAGFDRDVLFLENIWTANVFARRSLYEQYPYAEVDRKNGNGIEDWSWNIHTLWSGVQHLIVPETVHLVRIKEFSSLGRKNMAEGLLPILPELAWPSIGHRSE